MLLLYLKSCKPVPNAPRVESAFFCDTQGSPGSGPRLPFQHYLSSHLALCLARISSSLRGWTLLSLIVSWLIYFTINFLFFEIWV